MASSLGAPVTIDDVRIKVESLNNTKSWICLEGDDEHSLANHMGVTWTVLQSVLRPAAGRYALAARLNKPSCAVTKAHRSQSFGDNITWFYVGEPPEGDVAAQIGVGTTCQRTAHRAHPHHTAPHAIPGYD